MKSRNGILFICLGVGGISGIVASTLKRVQRAFQLIINFSPDLNFKSSIGGKFGDLSYNPVFDDSVKFGLVVFVNWLPSGSEFIRFT
jgi:hypothetical protein